MSDFAPGFASRHDNAGAALRRAFAPPEGFAAAGPQPAPREEAVRPKHFSPQSPEPRHFSPATAQVDGEFVDPVAAAHAAGFAEGIAAGLGQAAAAHGRDRALLEGLATALRSGLAFDRERVALQLRQTVLNLVTRLVGEVELSPALLCDRVNAAVELLADAAESAILRLHPDDLKLVDGNLPERVFAAGDASVARGGFVLESASTLIEDGPDLWLEQLTQAIDRVAVPA